mgnify:CR=1 FL=1
MSDDSYSPIPCGLYSEYEVAILHRTPLKIEWRDEHGATHNSRLIAKDLETRKRYEYLIAEDAGGQRLEISLDQIISHTEAPE